MTTSIVMSIFAAAAVTFQLLIISASASPNMKYIDAVCDRSNNIPFCRITLIPLPATADATSVLSIAETMMKLALTNAEMTTSFVDAIAKKDSTLTTLLTECHKAYLALVDALKSATLKLKTSPDTANNEVKASMDHMNRVTELFEKNIDKTSTTIKEMTVQMEKLLDIAAVAANAVHNDDQNLTPASASPNMKYIDVVCDRSHNVRFCRNTLIPFPPTAAATSVKHSIVETMMKLAITNSEMTASFVNAIAKKDLSLMNLFTECHKAYLAWVDALKSTTLKLKTSPDTANNEVKVSMDHMKRVIELVGKNTYKSSTTIKEMTV